MELVVRVPLRVPMGSVKVREALLIEGPAGWGESSPLPGYPCPPERARAAAEEAAWQGWPARRDNQLVRRDCGGRQKPCVKPQA